MRTPLSIEPPFFKIIFFIKIFSFYRSSFSDFAQKCGKDERFKGIEKMRDRESLFNEFIIEVRRREKDEKIQKKEAVSMSIEFIIYLFTNHSY